MEDSTPNLSITELGLRTRAVNVLAENGIRTVGGVLAALEVGDKALLSLKGFGPKSLADLKEKLRERGFDLPGEPVPEPEAEVAEPPAEVASAETVVEEPAAAYSEEAAAAVSTTLPTFREQIQATFVQATERIGIDFRLAAYGLVALLVIAGLLLPPVSLLRRLGLVGYTMLAADNETVSHPDGLSLCVDSESFDDRLRVRLDALPRLELLEGSAGKVLRKAVETLPSHLEVKSPLYRIQARGKPSQPVMIDVLVPNNAEPWETLDLYTWTGEAWEWVGSDLHTEVNGKEFIRAQVTDIPDSVVVVQTGVPTSTVSTSLGADDDVSRVNTFDEINPTGLLLGTMGGFAGSVTRVPQSAQGYAVLPTLRNWAPGGSVNQGLLVDMLTGPEIQEAHITNIVQLCIEQGYDGVDLDYRGIALDQRETYTSFINALAEALHAEDLRLTVAIERPTPTDGQWETGGYDLAALGASADTVKVPFPEDPTAYIEGGEAERLLNWVTAQVPRHKLRMLVSSLSAARSSSKINYLSLEQALASFGEVKLLADTDQIESNADVAFGLSGSLLGITAREAVGTYRLEYKGDDGESHTAWLGTASNLSTKLGWAKMYNLGGVAVADALDPGNAEGVLDVATSYPNVEAVSSPRLQDMQIAWTVASGGQEIDRQNNPLANPSYTWTAPETPGTYTVSASVVGFDHGSVTVTIPEPEVTEMVAMTVTEAVTETTALTDTATLTETDETDEGEEADEGECLDAVYAADVSVPDNTQFDNGEAFEKTWRVSNNGTCAWPEDTVLAFASGEQMGAPESVEVGAVEPDQTVEVSVKMEAPAEAGSYTGVWRMKAADGFFGGNLTVVIQAGEVAEAPAPAPAPTDGGGFELGGHVTNHGLPYAQQMHYAGMNWVKDQVHYGDDASGLIGAAHANGFKVQLSAIGGAGMVTKSGFEQDFANWVAGLAAAGADAIEVWNEPNIDREWKVGHISPQAYTNLLCTAYRAIKNANPNTMVISAAPSPTGYFGGCSPNGCDDQPWLQGLVNAGAAQCMDYIGAHHNAGATSPSASSGHPADQSGHHSWYFLPQTRLYYNIFGGARKIFYTEMGYASQEGVSTFSDQFAWARGIDNAEQAAWLSEAVQLSVNTGMVRCIIIWNVGRSRYGYDPQDGYNIIRPGGGCPACDALHNVLGTR